jgi:hypothetical protein
MPTLSNGVRTLPLQILLQARRPFLHMRVSHAVSQQWSL